VIVALVTHANRRDIDAFGYIGLSCQAGAGLT
jgi:hypothetical protein